MYKGETRSCVVIDWSFGPLAGGYFGYARSRWDLPVALPRRRSMDLHRMDVAVDGIVCFSSLACAAVMFMSIWFVYCVGHERQLCIWVSLTAVHYVVALMTWRLFRGGGVVVLCSCFFRGRRLGALFLPLASVGFSHTLGKTSYAFIIASPLFTTLFWIVSAGMLTLDVKLVFLS